MTRVVEVDLARPLQRLWGLDDYRAAAVLVRYRGQPLGWVNIATRGRSTLGAETLHQAIVAALDWRLPACVLAPRDTPPPADRPPITVVVCTRDRTDQLRGCLEAVRALRYPSYEILVVDNAPATPATAALTATLPVRYVLEPQPGLDHARNRGLSEARHDIVAFTDDDARPDPGWLTAVADAFYGPEVMAVTGLVAPAELETPAQELFERGLGGMGKGFTRRVFAGETVGTRQLLWASRLGVGANMAVRRDVMPRVGGFDPALDVGTPTRGGGDIDMLHRILAAGFTVVYEPAALVWHHHRRTMSELRHQIESNGIAFGAYLLTCGRNRTVSRPALAAFAVRHWLAQWLARRLLTRGRLPRRLVLAECVGALRSPLAYRRARAAARSVS